MTLLQNNNQKKQASNLNELQQQQRNNNTTTKFPNLITSLSIRNYHANVERKRNPCEQLWTSSLFCLSRDKEMIISILYFKETSVSLPSLNLSSYNYLNTSLDTIGEYSLPGLEIEPGPSLFTFASHLLSAFAPQETPFRKWTKYANDFLPFLLVSSLYIEKAVSLLPQIWYEKPSTQIWVYLNSLPK